MADATVSRLGQINGSASDNTALFLKVFGGEVLAALEKNTITLNRHTIRTISSGKSAQFPATGRITSSYHTPGTEILGSAVLANERVITIDGLLISAAFIADIDEAMNHYEVRSIYSTEMGRQLGYVWDENVFSEIILGARASATVTGLSGGSTITDSNMGSTTLATKADALGKALYAAAQVLDEKDITEDGRYAAFRPAEYYALVQAVQSGGFSAINTLYGGRGSYAEGEIVKVAGIEILKSNILPITNLSAKTYHGVNASTTKGVVWTKDAVGTVKLLDLSMQSEWDIRRQGTLMVARYAMGHGFLRPECCVELKTA